MNTDLIIGIIIGLLIGHGKPLIDKLLGGQKP